jgi:hypothetical protein
MKTPLNDREKMIIQKSKIASKMLALKRSGKTDYNKEYMKLNTEKNITEQYENKLKSSKEKY